MKQLIHMTLNGEAVDIAVQPYHTLLEVLREQLALTGTKRGCDVGDCGACTVILDGKPVNACIILAVECQGADILTIEGLSAPASGGWTLHPLQASFLDHGAAQCGFCTPGMIMAAYALLQENPHPTEDEARFAIAGNLCRCTGFAKIVEAIIDTPTAEEAS